MLEVCCQSSCEMLKRQTQIVFYAKLMEDERRHRMEEGKRLRQAVRDCIRSGKITTWQQGDPPPEDFWERIKRTIKKFLQ